MRDASRMSIEHQKLNYRGITWHDGEFSVEAAHIESEDSGTILEPPHSKEEMSSSSEETSCADSTGCAFGDL